MSLSNVNPRYITRPEQLVSIPGTVQAELAPICRKYAFRTNEYYLSLIDWLDPNDPIRRIIIPSPEEMTSWGRLDASDEKLFTIVPGVEHKYTSTALLLVNDICGGYCRFCFRKRLFMNGNDEVVRDITPGLEYIKEHPEITNVLLTGGDPLILSTRRLEEIIVRIRKIDHVQIIRIGTKMPAFNPHRILEDPGLVEMFERYSTDRKRIYAMLQFNHPRELTDAALQAAHLMQRAGVTVCNQTPLLRGVNDNPRVLAELMNALSFAGIPPYYVFQGRPTSGNRHFAIPVEESYDIFEQARSYCSGLAKRARLVMSHATGKIEILGKDADHVYFRYHRAAEPQSQARFMILRRNPGAYWFDDYEEIVNEYSLDEPYRCFGPE